MNKKSPGEAEGMQISFKESLEGQIFNLQGKEDLEGDIIKLKISGDGTCIGKRLKLHSKQKKKMQWMKRAIMSLLHLRQLRTMTISRKAWLI